MSSKWTKATIADVLELVIDHRGKTPKKLGFDDFHCSGYQVLSAKHVKTSGLTSLDSIRYANESMYNKWMKVPLQKGDVILTSEAPMGETYYIDGSVQYLLGQRVFGLRPKQELIEPLYLLSWLSSQVGQSKLKERATGSTVQGIKQSELLKVEIELPPLFVQRAIAANQSSISEKIQLNSKINQTLEQMAQAIFKSWFVDFDPVKAKIAALEAGGSEDDALLAAMQAIASSSLFASDAADADAATQLARLQAEHPEQYATLRATAELFPAAMQDSELGEIPAGWKVLPLSEMVELIGGGTPKRSEPAYWNGDICWFSVKDAPNDGNVFVIDTVEKITDAGLKGSSTKLLPLGTTIITARGTVGKLALTGVVTAMNQSCYGVIGIDGTGPYLNYLQMQEAVETLQRNTHGAVFDTITQATFGTVFQSQACISLRTNFENLVAPAFEMIKNNLQQIKALSELRDTLLPKLLSGELSISAATDQITKAEEAVNVQS
ncbi:restriction endonuclease subunit S [Thiopseudomonas acetoxidans]|uniref:Restriction endonuclease subunit S n=1 Tax=Thiopseudomonas acetoxidans TaxID=3041622 RepID=A0ABT7SLL2_9GAMM|nr:restriction endonuclease subunit S [Thiopseudomonas sp. CY1220]MDM7857082.1 restriction endonuclease subunit S [Thiopseudomonas sp. CY1220]